MWFEDKKKYFTEKYGALAPSVIQDILNEMDTIKNHEHAARLINLMNTIESEMEPEIKVGDPVSLPFNETGILEEIKNIPWGFTHVVRITKATLSEPNQLVDFKKDQLIPIK